MRKNELETMRYFFPLDWTGGHVIQAEKELELKECQDFSKSVTENIGQE